MVLDVVHVGDAAQGGGVEGLVAEGVEVEVVHVETTAHPLVGVEVEGHVTSSEHRARWDATISLVEQGQVHHLPVGRELFVDERGVGLRATWHLEHGFVNVSIWRDDVCTETFHLSVADAARLVGFLATGLATATEGFLADRDVS